MSAFLLSAIAENGKSHRIPQYRHGVYLVLLVSNDAAILFIEK